MAIHALSARLAYMHPVREASTELSDVLGMTVTFTSRSGHQIIRAPPEVHSQLGRSQWPHRGLDPEPLVAKRWRMGSPASRGRILVCARRQWTSRMASCQFWHLSARVNC